MSTKTAHFFSADRPIERLDEDRLQRGAFALSIAQAITTWHGDDSLVMALYGGWGDGKSSVKAAVLILGPAGSLRGPGAGLTGRLGEAARRLFHFVRDSQPSFEYLGPGCRPNPSSRAAA